MAATCESPQLHRAPVVTGDVKDDGTPVAASADRRGKRVPIVLVHGAGDDPMIETAKRTGPFAHPVDLSSGSTPVRDAGRSLLGELQNLPGTDVFSFDYGTWAGSWVDDEHVGPALGTALDCLFRATGEKAVVVTRSTGSLVARWAVTHPGQGGADRTAEVSTVVTFGATDLGATIGLLAPGGVVAAERAGVAQAAPLAATVRLLAAGCAAAKTEKADGSVCDQLDRTAPLAGSDLGRALTIGSSQLAALPAWPKGLALHSLSAGITLTLPAHGWFAAASESAQVAGGDLLDLSSALPKAAAPTVSCGVTLAGDGSGGWTVNATDSDDPGAPVAVATSACLGSDLTRNADLVASARSIVLADLFARQPLVAGDLLSAPIPSLCQGFWPAGVLTDGRYAGPNPDPNGYAQPPTLEAVDGRDGVLEVFGDLDGDGVGDAAAVVNCNLGGVGWPDYVLLWGSGLRLLGAFDMGDVVGDARGGTRSIAYADGKISVDSLDSRDWDAGCCSSGTAKVTLAYDGAKVVAADVQHLQGAHDLTFAGIGRVEIGMSRSDLVALGATGDPAGYTCSFYETPDGVDVTVDNASDKVIRVSLPYGSTEPAHTFPEGVGVGSTIAEVLSAYQGHTIDNLLDGGFGQGLNGILVKGDGGYLGFGTDDGVTVSSVDVSDGNDFGAREYCSG